MSVKLCIVVYLVLLALLAATAALSRVELGLWNVLLNLSIAAVKAALIALVFMRLWEETTLIRIFAAVGLVWLAVLLGLALTDYLDRDHPAEFYRGEPGAGMKDPVVKAGS